jgi:hypothetical protein
MPYNTKEIEAIIRENVLRDSEVTSFNMAREDMENFITVLPTLLNLYNEEITNGAAAFENWDESKILRPGVTRRSKENATYYRFAFILQKFRDRNFVIENYDQPSKHLDYLNLSENASDLEIFKALKSKVDSNKLLVETIVTEQGESYHLPPWQFSDDKLVEGLDEVIEILRPKICQEAMISYMNRFNLELNGSTPLEVLLKGQKDQVLAASHLVGTGMM